jgi:predicted O-methyltransferase YrrM
MLGNFKQDIQALKALDRARPRAPETASPAVVPAATGQVAAEAVRAEWVRVLGAAAFERDLGWEEAGGNSLQGLELIFELEGALRRPVPMTLLAPDTRPSELIAGIARLLDEDGAPVELRPPLRRGLLHRIAAALRGGERPAGNEAVPSPESAMTDPALAAAIAAADPFAAIVAATDAHRARHGCFARSYAAGPALAVVAAMADARRILELGTALGYTALWLARGAPEAQIDTVERDPEHVRIAREHVAAYGCAGRIAVHEDDYRRAMAGMAPPFDLIFFDGYGPTLDDLAQFRRLLRPKGVLVSSNLQVGSQAASYRAALLKPDWLTTFALEGGNSAVSVKL